MTPANLAALRAQLILHEGERLLPYVDTVGKITIGVGHNLTDRGIPKEISQTLLTVDLDESVYELDRTFIWFAGLDDIRQRALIDLHFNIGLPRFLTFRFMIKACATGQFALAAHELLDSKWASQVGPHRSQRLARMLADGIDPGPILTH